MHYLKAIITYRVCTCYVSRYMCNWTKQQITSRNLVSWWPSSWIRCNSRMVVYLEPVRCIWTSECTHRSCTCSCGSCISTWCVSCCTCGVYRVDLTRNWAIWRRWRRLQSSSWRRRTRSGRRRRRYGSCGVRTRWSWLQFCRRRRWTAKKAWTITRQFRA